MKKSVLLILAAVLALFALTACKDNEENEFPSSVDTSSVEEGTTESTEIQSTSSGTAEDSAESNETESTESESDETESESEGDGFETDENGNINLPEIPW